MTVSIKSKIRLGTLFLLLLLVLSGGLSIYYQLKLTAASENILKDNYESLSYCEAMTLELDSMPGNSAEVLARFENNLREQENNITEPGEKDATRSVRIAFEAIKQGDNPQAHYVAAKSAIHRILSLNMTAIHRKNLEALHFSEEAYTTIMVIVSLSLIIGLTFAFNFPSVVVTPIEKLMEAIREISARNYRYRIHLEQQDEFGQLAGAFNMMSERLEGFENSNLNKLIFEKSRAEAVINSLKDASIGIDKNNIVLFANQQALRLLGLRSEDTVGKQVSTLSAQNDLFKFLTESESTAPFKIVLEGKENFYTRETVQIEQGDSASKVIVLRNITSFKEMDVAKTNFIAAVSHELKTPLASSDFSLKLLEDARVGQLTDDQKALVVQLKNDNQRMLRILSELLNMSQVEAGRLQLINQPVSPYSIIDASMEAVSAAMKEKNITVEKHVAEALPDAEADPDKIGWVLNNFFTNAVKFSPEGGTVVLNVAEKEGEICFSVTDHGAGIELAYLDRIFERYFQVPGRTDKKGSGIGLAICKEIVEAMGGSVWVSSKPGEGSTFGFRLPVAKGV